MRPWDSMSNLEERCDIPCSKRAGASAGKDIDPQQVAQEAMKKLHVRSFCYVLFYMLLCCLRFYVPPESDPAADHVKFSLYNGVVSNKKSTLVQDGKSCAHEEAQKSWSTAKQLGGSFGLFALSRSVVKAIAWGIVYLEVSFSLKCSDKLGRTR